MKYCILGNFSLWRTVSALHKVVKRRQALSQASSWMQVYTMRDLNPMHFFRGPAPEAKPDASQVSKTGMTGQAKPMTKVPSLLFDIEVGHQSL